MVSVLRNGSILAYAFSKAYDPEDGNYFRLRPGVVIKGVPCDLPGYRAPCHVDLVVINALGYVAMERAESAGAPRPFVPDHPLWSDEYNALLRACDAAPGDDLPKQIMADWLDDAGEGELAYELRATPDRKPDVPASVWFAWFVRAIRDAAIRKAYGG